MENEASLIEPRTPMKSFFRVIISLFTLNTSIIEVFGHHTVFLEVDLEASAT